MPEKRTPSDASIPPELIELSRQFVAKLPGQLKAIEAIFQALSAGEWEQDSTAKLHRMVHNLTGSSGTFGLHEVSRLARSMELRLNPLIKTTTAPSATEWSALNADLAQLQALARNAPQSQAIPPPQHAVQLVKPCALVHIVSDSPASSERLQSALAQEGFRVVCFKSPTSYHLASLANQEEPPAVVVLDMAPGGDSAAIVSQIEQLGLAENPMIPLLVGLSKGDLLTRIAVSRAGARQSLLQPLSPTQVLDSINTMTGGLTERPWRVLLVDDEPTVLQAHAVYLREAGMEVLTLSDPLKTLEFVEHFQPEVLVLDVYMPEVNGPEIAAVLRECDICPHLAIVFLSAETDMTQQLVALDLGGDDFLIKPVQPRHFVAAVLARARRTRQNQIVKRRLETNLYERQREHLALDEHAIVSTTNAAGDIIYANDLFCQTSGYAREEVIGNNHRLLKSSEQSDGFYSEMWATITRGQVWQGEICNRHREGTLFWVECTITPFLDADGRPYQYVSIHTDITHIKTAEAALIRQRDMQRMISQEATRLMAAPAGTAKEAVTQALQASGEHLGATSAFLFRFSKDGNSMKNTHLWCSPSVQIDAEAIAQLQLQRFNWVRSWFDRDGMVAVSDASLMPEEAANERETMIANNARSFIAFPMMRKGKVSGFVGYASQHAMPSWTPLISEFLSVLSEVIASALARQQAESALRKSEARLSFLVSSSPVTIYTGNPTAPFAATYISPNVKQLLGFEANAFKDDPRFGIELMHPEDRSALFEHLPGLLTNGSHQHEFRSRTASGAYKWLLSEMRLVNDEEGQPLEVIGYAMDITERKRIEEELFKFNHELEARVVTQTQNMIESERISRATLDAMSARVVILNEQGVILAANRAWIAFQEPRAEGEALLEGLNYLNFCDRSCDSGAEAGAVIAAGIRAIIAGEQVTFLHEYTSHLPGEQRWYVCRVEPFSGDGAVRVVVSHEDITAMKQIERQQMRSQRLESLGTLAGGVAHDLNNSLAPILMGMGILKDQYPEEQKLINMIHNSARRGADMVRQLLTFAKGVDGKREAVQPAHLVTELESLMRGSFPKNIELQVETAPDLPTVVGDATQLHQILLNLCVNARDAMPHGGTLAVQAKTVEIDAIYARTVHEAKAGHYVCLKVSDTGEGIPPAILDRIFDPFFTTKSQEKGTGLGLSTVLGIIKGHGGFVQVHSAPGKGSTFSVYLPIAQGEAGDITVPTAAQTFRGQGELVLFVDDESALREVGKTVLERLNVTPMVAVDGEDGLIKATENRANLKAIITDMHMPHMDGLAFVHAVRRTLPEIPIILASGRVDDHVAKEFKALGVTLRLDKPFTELQLAELLGCALRPKAA